MSITPSPKEIPWCHEGEREVVETLQHIEGEKMVESAVLYVVFGEPRK
jgi:hypothetical protein